MNSPTGREPDPSALEEELVAYLDDELDDEARRRLERRLTEEPTVRESLRKLTRVWDALETLPRAEVSESFATTTVEAVVFKEQQSQANTLGARLRKSRDWWLKTAVALAACALVSFIAARLIWPDPNVQLAEDLPILQNLDAYRSIENIEFARLLAQENVFPAEKSSPPPAATSEAGEAALTRIANSEGPDKALVAGNWQRLEGVLAGPERERLRALERELKQDPKQAELRRVMLRYHEWLGSLNTGQRTALSDITDPQARLKRMREMMLADLPDEDRRVVHEWLEEYVRVHEEELVERAKLAPWTKRFPRLEKLDNAARRWVAMGALMQCMMEPGGREDELPFTEFDFERLEMRLSPEPSKRLRELEDVELKKLALAEWWRTMVRESFGRPTGSANYSRLFGPEAEGGLAAEEKNEIFMLPPEEADRALKQEGAMRFGGDRFGRPGGGFGPPPGPPPGERGERRGGRRGDRDRNHDDWSGDDDPPNRGPHQHRGDEPSDDDEKSPEDKP